MGAGGAAAPLMPALRRGASASEPEDPLRWLRTEIEVVDSRNREENEERWDASNGSCAVPFQMSRERLGLGLAHLTRARRSKWSGRSELGTGRRTNINRTPPLNN
jgi:hypothetical protein